jgi:hypothetical protein
MPFPTRFASRMFSLGEEVEVRKEVIWCRPPHFHVPAQVSHLLCLKPGVEAQIWCSCVAFLRVAVLLSFLVRGAPHAPRMRRSSSSEAALSAMFVLPPAVVWQQSFFEKILPRVRALCSKCDQMLVADRQTLKLPILERMKLSSRELETWVRLVTPTVKRALSDAATNPRNANHAAPSPGSRSTRSADDQRTGE